MSSKQPILSHLNWVFHVHVWSFDPKGVFVDFSKGPIMSKFIYFCECIFNTWDLKMNCRELHLLQNELWMVILDKIWESYAWSKLSWLFLQNPNLATFEFWWIWRIPWGIMINPWSNDGYNFKMLMLTKNLEIWLYVGHSWLLT